MYTMDHLTLIQKICLDINHLMNLAQSRYLFLTVVPLLASHRAQVAARLSSVHTQYVRELIEEV